MISKDKSFQAIYVALVTSEAWKDIEEYIKNEIDLSMRRVDDKPASDLNLGVVCEERGIRKGLLKILRYVETKAEGV